MASADDIFKVLGIPAHEEPEVGSFIVGLDGRWRHTCAADFPFQEDVEIIFDLVEESPPLPPTMPQNVSWIMENLADIWNAAALAINNMMEAKEIELEGDFQLEPLHFRLPDLPVQSSPWNMSIEPSGVDGAFEVTFRGLSVIEHRYEAS